MKQPPIFEGYLQVYAEVAGYTQALAVARELIDHAQQYLRVEKLYVEPYWKIPEYYGITLFFQDKDLASMFDALLYHFASGWEPVKQYSDFQEAIWNLSQSTGFINPLVRWAQLNISPSAQTEQPMEPS